MNKNERPSFFRGKGAAVGIVICFVAVIAIVGAYTFNNYQRQIDEQVAKSEDQAEQLTEDSSEETTADDIVLPQYEETENDESGSDAADADNGNAEPAGVPEETDEIPETADETSASGSTSDVWFSEDSTLAWPASGAVLISYSMDHTVFFQTLEQYKYNPAMIIGGQVGETISASAAGIVTAVEESAQTGMTVTLDMGNGYSAVYGQLTEIPVAAGDYVGAGEALGVLAEPTKYYSVEGPNLYFEILKDGTPVDPMNYIE